jgi:hypothetical protein
MNQNFKKVGVINFFNSCTSKKSKIRGAVSAWNENSEIEVKSKDNITLSTDLVLFNSKLTLKSTTKRLTEFNRKYEKSATLQCSGDVAVIESILNIDGKLWVGKDLAVSKSTVHIKGTIYL